MSETYETIQRRPEYIEQREQALLDKIFGTSSGGVYTGGCGGSATGGICDG